ncbi:MAG: chemotaxis protein CheW [Sphingomonas sp.]
MSDLFLIARIVDRAVAIASDQVESVVDIGEIVPVPGADPRVRGLAALRSKVMTVIDPHVALGLPPLGGEGHRAVITSVDGHHYAIMVDALDDVTPCVLSPLSGGIRLDDAWREIGCGIVELEGQPVLAIDCRALVPGAAAVT